VARAARGWRHEPATQHPLPPSAPRLAKSSSVFGACSTTSGARRPGWGCARHPRSGPGAMPRGLHYGLRTRRPTKRRERHPNTPWTSSPLALSFTVTFSPADTTNWQPVSIARSGLMPSMFGFRRRTPNMQRDRRGYDHHRRPHATHAKLT